MKEYATFSYVFATLGHKPVLKRKLLTSTNHRRWGHRQSTHASIFRDQVQEELLQGKQHLGNVHTSKDRVHIVGF